MIIFDDRIVMELTRGSNVAKVVEVTEYWLADNGFSSKTYFTDAHETAQIIFEGMISKFHRSPEFGEKAYIVNSIYRRTHSGAEQGEYYLRLWYKDEGGVRRISYGKNAGRQVKEDE